MLRMLNDLKSSIANLEFSSFSQDFSPVWSRREAGSIRVQVRGAAGNIEMFAGYIHGIIHSIDSTEITHGPNDKAIVRVTFEPGSLLNSDTLTDQIRDATETTGVEFLFIDALY